MSDLSSGITGSLSRDGLGGMRAPLQMGGFTITNLAAGVADSDAVRMDQVSSAGVPIGAVIDWAGPTAPNNYMLCYGQEVSRSDYADLFSAIGVTWGSGNGTTTFNLPDARGRVSAGKDNMGGVNAGLLSLMNSTTLGGTGGSQVHTLDITQIPSHSHGVTDAGHVHDYSIVSGSGGIATGSGLGQTSAQTSGATTGISIQSTGGGLPHNNIQPTIIFNKIIRVM